MRSIVTGLFYLISLSVASSSSSFESSASSISTSSWTLLSPDNPTLGPSPRFGSIALLLSAQTKTIAISGGCSSSCCYAPLGDIWVFQNNQWSNVTQDGTNLPSNRLFHSSSPSLQSAGVTSSFFVFGGTDIVNGDLNDLWTLTITASGGAIWKEQVVPGTLPGVRSGQSQNALSSPSDPGSFIIFGGEDPTDVLSDAWIFSPLHNTWNKVSFTTGSGPSERTQHASVTISLPISSNSFINGLIISGGSDSDGDDANDIWLLTISPQQQQGTWILLGQGGSSGLPSVRHGHSLWLSSQSQRNGYEAGETIIDLEFYMFGGQNCSVPDPINFLSDTWLFSVSVAVSISGQVTLASGQGTFSLIDAGGSTGPSARALGGLGALSPGNSSNAIYATGFSGYEGGNDDRLHNDVWLFKTSSYLDVVG